MKKEDVKVTFEPGLLGSVAKRHNERRQEDQSEIRAESFYGFFSRTFPLPDNVAICIEIQ